MKYFALLFLSISPVFTNAQHSFGYGEPVSKMSIGFGTGFGTGLASSEQIKTAGAGLAANGNLRLIYNMRKWQVGVGIDCGAVTKGSIERDVTEVEVWNGDTTRINKTDGETAQFATPYYSPQIFVNYKINLPGDLYFYTGGIVGYTFSQHGFNIKPRDNTTKHRKVNGLMVGANLGLVIRLNDFVSIEMSESWRMSMLKDPDPNGYYALEQKTRTGFAANYQWWYDPSSLVQKYNAHIFVTSFGLRFNL